MTKRLLLLAISLVSLISASLAQSRVFTEVNNGITSQVKPIMQDNSLIGYVVFSRLEKTKADSFHYKLTIIDENLNDIGTYSFNDQSLEMQHAAFDQDVLCLSYLRCDAPGSVSVFTIEKITQRAHSSIYTQFLNLKENYSTALPYR